MPCQEVVELVTGYLEGALDPATAAAVDAHLRGCQGCENYVDQMRAAVAALRQLRSRAAPQPRP